MKSAFGICRVVSVPENELCRTSDQRVWLHCQTELGSNETQNGGLWLLLHLTTLVKHVLDLMWSDNYEREIGICAEESWLCLYKLLC